jgi:hypothetical protein
MFDAAGMVQTVGADDEEWGEFLAAAFKTFGDETWTAKELLARVSDDLAVSRVGRPVA